MFLKDTTNVRREWVAETDVNANLCVCMFEEEKSCECMMVTYSQRINKTCIKQVMMINVARVFYTLHAQRCLREFLCDVKCQLEQRVQYK